MPRSGTGNYSPPSGNPVVTNTTISSTVQNNTVADIGNEITNSIARDGQSPPTANLPMGGFRHTGAGDAVLRTDYATYGQVQDNKATWSGSAGGSADALTVAPSVAVTAYVAGQRFEFFAISANATTTPTVSISGVTAATLTNRAGGALLPGDIQPGIVEIVYDGTTFRLVGVDSKIHSGLQTPAYRLDLSDNQNASAGARISNPNNGASARAQILLNNDTGGVGSGLFKNSSGNSGSPGGTNGLVLMNSSAANLSLGTNSIEQWRIDTNGLLTNPANSQPIFNYSRSANITSGTNATILFDTAAFTQIGSGYNPATGLFTAPVTGLYMFGFAVEWGNTTGGTIAIGAVVGSGAAANNVSGYLPTAQTISLSGTAVYKMTFGDTALVKFSGTASATKPVNGGVGQTYFWGRLIG